MNVVGKIKAGDERANCGMAKQMMEVGTDLKVQNESMELSSDLWSFNL